MPPPRETTARSVVVPFQSDAPPAALAPLGERCRSAGAPSTAPPTHRTSSPYRTTTAGGGLPRW